METKTKVMRLLDKQKINYKHYCYVGSKAVSGLEVAEFLHEDPAKVFKTLVTVGKSGQHFVFMLPVAAELDLKKAAAAVHEKAVEMIKSKELLPLTGYIHGGCSPLGMKKTFLTTIDSSAEALESIIFSAGKIGYQVEVAPNDLKKIIRFDFADLRV